MIDRSISARLRDKHARNLAGDLIGLIEHAVGAGSRSLEAVEQLLDLGKVTSQDWIHRAREFPERRQRLLDVLAVIDQVTLAPRASRPRRA